MSMKIIFCLPRAKAGHQATNESIQRMHAPPGGPSKCPSRHPQSSATSKWWLMKWRFSCASKMHTSNNVMMRTWRKHGLDFMQTLHGQRSAHASKARELTVRAAAEYGRAPSVLTRQPSCYEQHTDYLLNYSQFPSHNGDITQ